MTERELVVTVIRDTVSRQNFDIPEGSVLQEVKEFKHCYRGLYCSMNGSYYATVPKKDCVVGHSATNVPRPVLRPVLERANACKLTECQGQPRCKMCRAMDLAHNGGWGQMHDAPHEQGPVLLLVPTRWAKHSTHIQAQGEWFGSYWGIFNADEAVQRVEPVGWRPLHGLAMLKTPNV